MHSGNERQSGNEGKECVIISSLLIQHSHSTLRAKPSWITLLYMCAQVRGIQVSTLVSIHEHIQGEAVMAVSPSTGRSSSRMALLLGVTAGEVAMSTFSPTNTLPPSHLSHLEYGAMPAAREWELGNMDVPVRQPSYGYR